MVATPDALIEYDRAIRVDEGVYWVGFADWEQGFHCNPYLIVDHGQAVLFDAGSRPDFSAVMMKILDIVEPSAIQAIILHHYDPDLCGSVPIFEEMIGNDKLVVISHAENAPFIAHYAVRSPIVCVERDLAFKYTFASGRELRFARTPYSHSAGSFVTCDTRTGIVFTSDIFGHMAPAWSLFTQFDDACFTEDREATCCHGPNRCPVPGMIEWHRHIMTSNQALRHAVEQIERLQPSTIAPQHGSILYRPQDVQAAFRLLRTLDGVGIDGCEVSP